MPTAADLLPIKDESDPIFSLPEGPEAGEWDSLFWQGWQAFNEGSQPGWIRKSILQSWRRSREYGIDPGVLRRNPRFFRYPSFSPATSASRSIISLLLWKV